eukprot:gene10846-12634_t
MVVDETTNTSVVAEAVVEAVAEEEEEDEYENKDISMNIEESIVEENDPLLESLPIPAENEEDKSIVKRSTVASKKRPEEEHQLPLNYFRKEGSEEQQHQTSDSKEDNANEPVHVIPKSKVPPIVEELLERLQILESGAEEPASFLPRKSNWDLKRDVEKKLARLEKKTNASIYELIKQKLSKEDEQTRMNMLTRTVDKSKF